MSRVDYSPELVRQVIREERLMATIAGLHAELAALKARPALPWRRREEEEELRDGFYLVYVEVFGEMVICEARMLDDPDRIYLSGNGVRQDISTVTHYIPWADLTPPGGEDAS
jgi:hypothetical protein